MSNTIYSIILPVISQDKNKFNFVYQITELSTGMKYIGSHGTEKSDPLKDLKKYKSSTTDSCFELNQKYNPLNYYYEILSYHFTRADAYTEEGRLHKLYDVKCNYNYYNKSNQEIDGFNTFGKFCAKDVFGNMHFVNCDDPRYLSGKLTGNNKGMLTVRDIDYNIFSVSLDDPRYLSGEFVHINKRKTTVKDKYCNTFMVSVDDPRYLSDELVGVNKGRVNVIDEDGNIFKTAVDNPDYLSGKLKYYYVKNIPSAKGKVLVRDKADNYLLVSVDDSRYLSGDLIPANKCMITVYDEFGVKQRISTDHPDYVSGKLKSIYTGNGNVGHIGYTKAKDRYGNFYTIAKGDERILSGELIGHSAFWYKINGIIYSTIEAEKEFGLKIRTIRNRCKSDLLEWKDWTISL